MDTNRYKADQGIPAPLRRHLAGHEVDTVFERGWSEMDNGALLDHTEEDGYQLLVTTGRHLLYQQNLSGRTLATMVLLAASWPRIQRRAADIRAAVDRMEQGQCTEVPV